MMYEVTFANPKAVNGTAESRVVAVHLTADEIEKAGGNQLYLMAYAMRHAYREVPSDWVHLAPPRKVELH